MRVRIRGGLVPAEVPTMQWGPTDLKNRIQTVHFEYEYDPAITNVYPAMGDDVVIKDDADATILFQGHIAMLARGGRPTISRWAVDCQDLNALLDKTPEAGQTFAAGMTDAAMVRSILGQQASGFIPGNNPPIPWWQIGLANPSGSDTIQAKALKLPAYTTPGTTLRAALDGVAALVGGVPYYIDAQRIFHWNDRSNLASFVLTTRPDGTANTTYMDGYSEFLDRTSHFFRITAANGGISATVTDWVAFGVAQRIAAGEPQTPAFQDKERILQAVSLSDSAISSVAMATQRAYAELGKYAAKRTIRTSIWKAGLTAGMLVDVVHDVWGLADIRAMGATVPVPAIFREVPAHSNVRGELAVGARGRYLVQKVTTVTLMGGSGAGPGAFRYDLELGDYEADLQTTIARGI